MEFDFTSLLPLCAFAFLAGFVDSMVGGGGLVQLPALFVFLPRELAGQVALVFGTNKLVSICGTGVAAVQYARRMPVRWHSILPAGMAAFVFSFIGARLVAHLESHYSQLLRPVIWFLLVAVAVHAFLRKDFGRLHQPQFAAGRERWLGVLVGAGIGFYDGFFGPGTGSFLLFIFIGLFGFDFLNASASAKFVNFTTNLSAVIYFGATGNIRYDFALPMAACNVAGALTGTRLAMLKGNAFVRGFFLAVVTVMILRFGHDIFLKP